MAHTRVVFHRLMSISVQNGIGLESELQHAG